MSDPRRYERCAECRRRVMLPRWVDGTLYAGDTGAEWYCMDCSGESATERIEWARDEEQESPRTSCPMCGGRCTGHRVTATDPDDLYDADQRASVATIRAAEPLAGDDLAAAQQLATDARGEIEG